MLEGFFGIKDNRKISVQESAQINELQFQMNEQKALLEQQAVAHKKEMEALYRMAPTTGSVFSIPFDGEKSLGGIGPAKDYYPDYQMLRYRSWQAYLDSDIAQTVINKHTLWVIGQGLKLNAEPKGDILAAEKVEGFDEQTFEKLAEMRYNLYANSKMSDYADMASLNKLASRGYKNATVGGDVLCLDRYTKGNVKMQLVDGAHVVNPLGMDGVSYSAREGYYMSGNHRIINGVKVDHTNKHLGYYISTGFNKYEYVKARDSRGNLRAWLWCGLEYRLDDMRGIPLIAAVMEKLYNMDDYDAATLKGAKSRAELAYFFEHQAGTGDENPMDRNLMEVSGAQKRPGDIPTDSNGEAVANKVAVQTGNFAINLPEGTTVNTPKSDMPEQFKDFFTVHINRVAACMLIPPDVAMSMYNSNYSASRAAIKDWEHVVNVTRDDVSKQFYQPNYNFWLDMQILTNKIKAEGYLSAIAKNDEMSLAAYRNARFTGAQVPHIDPLKEVKAEREKLGPMGAVLPLTNPEQSLEALNGGELQNNIEKLAEYYSKLKALGLIPETQKTDNGNTESDSKEE